MPPSQPKRPKSALEVIAADPWGFITGTASQAADNYTEPVEDVRESVRDTIPSTEQVVAGAKSTGQVLATLSPAGAANFGRGVGQAVGQRVNNASEALENVSNIMIAVVVLVLVWLAWPFLKAIFRGLGSLIG
jgi:hypothetical protein